MSTRQAPSALWTAVPGAVAALLAGQALVLGRPLVLCLAVLLGGFVASGLAHARWPADCSRRDLHLRLAVETGLITAAVHAVGWGSIIVVCYLMVALHSVAISGSRAARPAMAWATAGLAAGQLSLAAGLAPTLVDASVVHEVALLGTIGLWLVTELAGASAAERERAQERLAHRAYHDPLTELPNRAAFVELLDRAVARARRHGQGVAVLFLDLDGFKAVNDRLGHQAGDELLVQLGRRLKGCVRTEEPIGRLGGDEFAILLEDLETAADTTRVASRVIAAVADGFVVDGQEVTVRASVGIAVSRGSRAVADELLRGADDAMYLAKARGGSRWEIHDEGTGSALAALRRSGTGPIRVLLADDTSAIRQLLAVNLELDGDFEVVGEAANGADAVALAEALSPDVVVLDVAMPVMDGLQAIPLIRQGTPSTKIVVLSGFASDRLREQARQAGADAYLEKGSNPKHLVRALASLCRPAAVDPVHDVAAVLNAALDQLVPEGGERRAEALAQLVQTVVDAVPTHSP